MRLVSRGLAIPAMCCADANEIRCIIYNHKNSQISRDACSMHAECTELLQMDTWSISALGLRKCFDFVTYLGANPWYNTNPKKDSIRIYS